MKAGLISLRIAQAIFITIIVMLTIRHYTEKEIEYNGQQVQVQECTTINPFKTRCVSYIAIMKDGNLTTP